MLHRQFWELLVRGVLHRLRSTWDFASLAILYLISGVIYGLMYLNLKNDSNKVKLIVDVYVCLHVC